MKTLYFAYGSNMSTERMRSRAVSAKPMSSAILKNKLMLFNKRSVDGSGKANLVDSPGDVTWGILYEVDSKDLDRLDKIESGYERIMAQAQTADGSVVVAFTYISSDLTDEPVAYEWYKVLVLSGAHEHNLPQAYIAYIQQLPSKTGKANSKEG
jgi:gamma-glutamylcyclotransferase